MILVKFAVRYSPFALNRSGRAKFQAPDRIYRGAFLVSSSEEESETEPQG